MTTSADRLRTFQLPSGEFIGQTEGSVTSGTIILGPTGAGKTTVEKTVAVELVSMEYLVVAFDRKHEWRHLATFPALRDKTTVLDVADSRIAYGQPAPGADDKAWGVQVCAMTAVCYGRVFAQRLMHQIFEELRKALAGTGQYVMLSRLEAAVDKFRPGWGRTEAQFRESIRTMLWAIENVFGGIFDYSSSDFLEKLFARPGLLVIEAGTLPPEHYTFVVCFIARWLDTGRRDGRLPRWPKVAFFLDDATVAADAQRDREAPGGTSPLAELTFMGRAQEIAFFIAAHSIGSVSPKILANLQTKYVLGFSGEDPRLAQHLLGTTPEQTERLRALRPGELVALIPSVWPKPVYGRFPMFTTPATMNDAQCRALAQRFLSKVTAIKPAVPPQGGATKPATPTPTSPAKVAAKPATAPKAASSPSPSSQPPSPAQSAPSPDALRLLTLLAVERPSPITELYAKLGLTRGKGAALVKRLETDGVVIGHSFTTRRRGGQVRLLEITAKGWQALKPLGFHPPAPRTGGGWEHNLAADLLHQRGKEQQMTVLFEVLFGPRRADVLWKDRSGAKTLFNIGVSSPAREANNALELQKTVGGQGTKVVLVARDAAFARKFRDVLNQQDPKGDSAKQVLIRLIADYLEP